MLVDVDMYVNMTCGHCQKNFVELGTLLLNQIYCPHCNKLALYDTRKK